MSQKDSYDVAIVGGGPGGLNASIYAIRADLKTVLLEKGISGGQLNSTDKVENYLGYSKIDGAELAIKFTEHTKSYNLETIPQEVVELKKKGTSYELMLSNGQAIRSIAVILATGGSPRKLEIPGENEFYGSGVSYCATCDGFFFRNKTVLVVGGGDSASEESVYLSKLCSKVYLAHRGDHLRASKILAKRVSENKKITILWNTLPSAIIAKNSEVSSVELVNTKTNKAKEDLKVDGVFIFIGYEPNNHLAPSNLALDNDGLVITNESCETNMPGLYVIGDLRSKPARQIILSAADGCNAALAAAKYIESIKHA